MRTISNRLPLLAAAAALPALASAAEPNAAACPSHLETIAPKLEQSGYAVSWQPEAPARFLRASHVEAAGRVDIEYRCDAQGLGVLVVNHGLPSIPFHVLLAAGPSARHSQAMPEWLRERHEAVTR